MEHNHNRPHEHSTNLTNANTAFIVGISLNFIFVIIETIAGLVINSLSLLSDAGHNLADVGTLALSLLAFRLMKLKSNKKYTYGYRKASILVALFNSIVLLVSIGAIIYEAVNRFNYPEPLPGKTIAIVAGIGIIINSFTALMFFRDKNKDINIKSAYLHLMSDALVSLGIVIGGIIMLYTQWFRLDSILSIAIAAIILLSTWRLLRKSLHLSLDGVPDNICLDDIKTSVLKIEGVKDIHHIHIWAISSAENALTAHLVIMQGTTLEKEQKIKQDIRQQFGPKNIHHITLEVERDNDPCKTTEC
jgi:cobalt-zinc-cadmium efflux system protein